MRNGKFAKRGVASKALVLILALMLVVGATIGGTLAWLVDDSKTVTNTFTTNDIEVTLAETKKDFSMVPGHTIDKDPEVTVTEQTTVDAWLFVQVTKSKNLDQYITYNIADGWDQVDGTDNVYARKVMKGDTTKKFSVLKNDEVTVMEGVTKELMATAKTDAPTLTFKAYATQLYKSNGTEFSAAGAWDLVKPAANT